MRVLIVLDYRGQFWLKTTHKEANYDLDLLVDSFRALGYPPELTTFSQLRFDGRSYADTAVVYQSTQDDGLLYKSYIEDVLLGLKLGGATLVPDFHYFRAHHNKVFMEILRRVSGLEEIQRPNSRWFGTYEEYSSALDTLGDGRLVFKLSDGDQSKHVRLLNSTAEKLRIPRRLSWTFNPYFWLVDKIKPFMKGTYPGYRHRSDRRRKFIVQDFISGLDGDYKVLVFADKYYVLHRKNRENDFRASGSGLFSYQRQLPTGLLDFAKTVFDFFKVPFISMDVAMKDSHFFLMEFQFVSFGCYTLEKSQFRFTRRNDEWVVVEGESVLEREFAASVVKHLERSASLEVRSTCV